MSIKQYDVSLNNDKNNSDWKILHYVKPESIILEFGPAYGRMTKYMKEMLDCKVYIVEIDKEAYKKAIKYAKGGICGNIIDYLWVKKFKGIKFDHIIFADVLEHLINPFEVLEKSVTLLKDNGSVLISVPNMAHSSIVINLIKNKLEYRESGLLDETHIKFFTYSSLIAMLEKSSLIPVIEDGVIIFPENTEFKNSCKDIIADTEVIENREFANVYQFVFKCIRKDYYLKNKDKNSIQKIYDDKTVPSSVIFFDQGSGFTPNNHIIIPLNKQGNKFEININIQKNVKGIRFDPYEGYACIISDLQIITNNDVVEYTYTNGININNVIIFDTIDPQIAIDFNGKTVYKVKISGDIYRFNFENISLLSKCKWIFEQYYKIEDINKGLITERNNLVTEIDKLTAERNGLLNSRSWRLTKPLRDLTAFIRRHRLLHFFAKGLLSLKRGGIKEVVKKTKVYYNNRRQLQEWLSSDDNSSIRPFYSIDICEFKNNLLTIKGWFFLPDKEIENLCIIISDNKNDYTIKISYGFLRNDVYNTYNIEDAKYSGFIANAKIWNIKNFQIFIQYYINGKLNKIYIDTIRASRISKSNYKNKLYKIPRVQEITDSIFENINITEWINNNVLLKPDFENLIYNGIIDIIIPIYNGFKYFDTLFTTLPRTKINYRLFIIDDCSPDERVAEYLKKLADGDDRITVITNNKNMGFVKTVNKAIKYTSNHIALLNSDIELPPFWLERLMYPILYNEKIASSTPFTNSGTICSFPNFCEDNVLFENLSCEKIDLGFQKIKPSYTEIPTGVGFCMGMNKEVLQKIGSFDEAFFRGYGEENDWCQRAIQSGYKNVLVENLFVYHKHGGSFLNDEKRALIEKNSKLLSKKHPSYKEEVSVYCEKNPSKHIRNFVVMYLLAKYKITKQLLILNHDIGGGATDYLENIIRQKLKDSNAVILIRYNINKGKFIFEYRYINNVYVYEFEKIENLSHILEYFPCQEIYINELVTYPDIYFQLDFIAKIKEKFNSKMIVFLHDYYCLCPAINLLNDRQNYCDLPEIELCQECFEKKSHSIDYENIQTWREHWSVLLKSCDEIIAFSGSSKKLFERVYGTSNNLTVNPHSVDYIVKPNKIYKNTKTINIGLMGILCNHKGLKIIEEMLALISHNNMGVKIILIGYSETHLQHPCFSETGKYLKETLPLLVMQNDIDVFFISSICPETFSFTTEEVIKMDMPVAVFNIGAPVERVAIYNKGLVIDNMEAKTALYQIIDFYKKRELPLSPYYDQKILFIGEDISFSLRYRVEHFREQLLTQGVKSDFCKTDELNNITINDYSIFVIYRCQYTPVMAEFIEKCREENKKIFYEIDDFIFEYRQIKKLKFLQDKEYNKFKKYSRKIRKCMSLCDGFLTSTVTMRTAIQNSFLNIPVCVNRNVASMEMVSLSYNARKNINKSKEKIILGYFSGSKTHDNDFEVISEVLISLFERYENLYLKVVGYLKMNDALNVYKNRIINSDFVDWRKLPELISSVDINLMPLEDTFFNKCKSENKWTEAALVCVPTICSFNEELALVIQNGITGFLCQSSLEWKQILSNLIEKPELREQIGNAANQYVLANCITTLTGQKAKDFVINQ